MSKLLMLFLFFMTKLCFGQNNASRITELEFKSMNKLIRIVADSSKKDKEMGYCYRLLSVYSNSHGNEHLTKQILLPVNSYWDYDYKLNDKFEGTRNFLIVQGTWMFFVFDLETDSLSEAIVPQFSIQDGIDAQSGQLRDCKLSTDGYHFSGLKLDYGNFSFDLSDLLKPKQIKLEIK